MKVLNIRLKLRASVSSPPHSGHRSPWTWSARKRCLQLLQSTSGSVKFCRWPEASQVRGCCRMALSRPTTSLRVVHHLAPPGLLDVALELDAERAVVPGRTESAVNLAGGKNDSAALAEVDQLFHRDRALGARGRCFLDFQCRTNEPPSQRPIRADHLRRRSPPTRLRRALCIRRASLKTYHAVTAPANLLLPRPQLRMQTHRRSLGKPVISSSLYYWRRYWPVLWSL